jgi:hypothetical protein
MNSLKKEILDEVSSDNVSKPVQFLKKRVDNYQGYIEEYPNGI